MHLSPWPRRAASVALLSACSAVAPLTACAAGPEVKVPTSKATVLPDAPNAQTPTTPSQQTQPTPTPGTAASGSGSAPSGSGTAPRTPAGQIQTPPAPATTPASQNTYDLNRAEHQRILGIIPEFQAVNGAITFEPLTPKEKFHLMWRSSTDPYIFTLDAIVAGIGQAKDSNPGFHQGAEGYFKRYGASYADTFDGNFWGNAVLTVAFKEDPRYFREGEGHSYAHRALYSAGTALWTRRDTGKWGPNYANVIGNFISGGISNLYYPAADRGIGKTVTGALTVTAEGTIGSELEEFWPDISRKFFPKRYRKTLQTDQEPPAAPATPAQPGTSHLE